MAESDRATTPHHRKGTVVTLRKPISINDIRTAIQELSVRADLAHKEGRHDEAYEIEQRIQGYRNELSERP